MAMATIVTRDLSCYNYYKCDLKPSCYNYYVVTLPKSDRSAGHSPVRNASSIAPGRPAVNAVIGICRARF